MGAAFKPENEQERLRALREYQILDTPDDPSFDVLTSLAAHIAGAPIALISLIDAERQWFKSRYGLAARETAREVAFCNYVVASGDALSVPDTLRDERFATHPHVLGDPHVRFYCGFPLRTPKGHVLGTLCVVGRDAQTLDDKQYALLEGLAGQVVDQLELHKRNHALSARLREIEMVRRFFDESLDLFCTVDAQLLFQDLNPAWEEVTGWTREELRATELTTFVHSEDLQQTINEAVRLREAATATVDFRHRFRCKDGRWVLLSWSAIYSEGLFFACARDVTRASSKQKQLESALQTTSEVQKRLQDILDGVGSAIVEIDPDGMIRECNATAQRMLGYPPLHGQRKLPFTAGFDLAQLEARAELLSRELGARASASFDVLVEKARRGLADEQEWTFRRPDGSSFPISLSMTARRDASGTPVGFLAVATDISARKQTEAQLRESRVRLNAVFEGMAEGAIIQDSTGAICEANPAAERILGISRADLLRIGPDGSGLTALRLDGTLMPREQYPSRQTLLTGEPQNDVVMEVQKPSGESALISVNARPLSRSLEPQRPDAVLATFRDITKQAQIERALREQQAALQVSETRLRSIIDTAAEAIITLDEHGVIERANTAVASLFGYQPVELVGKNVLLLVHPRDGLLHSHPARSARHEPAPTGNAREVTAERRDGTHFAAELSASEFFVEGKQYFTWIIRDISDRKRVERLQSEFVSTVSHELRTPLTSIRGALGLIVGGVLGEVPEEVHEYVGIALANSERLARLINDILDMEKVQSGTMDFHWREVDLTGAVESAVSANQAFAAAHQVRLRVDTAARGNVLVDPDRLAQILTNLISNATKFSPAGGEVVVRVECAADEHLRVSVRDHGPGISAEFRGRIFQRFAQADSSSTREKGGTGLGLSITKALVEKMRGRIDFASADGGGTIFYFELPHVAVERITDTPLVPGAQVLVCAADDAIAQTLERALGAAGYRVDFARTSSDAHRRLAAARYSAFIVDLTSVDSGVTLISELRRQAAMTDVPIVAIASDHSALGDAAVLVSDSICEPMDEKKLLEVLDAVISQQGHASLLHVEDDPDIRRIIHRTLPSTWQVTAVATVAQAKLALMTNAFDFVLLDLTLPDGAGEELLQYVGRAQVIIFSAIEAPAALTKRVAAALVKSRSRPVDVREAIVALLAKAGPLLSESHSESQASDQS